MARWMIIGAVVASGVVAEAQTPVFRVAWDQVAPTMADASGYLYEASIDGAPTAALAGVTCAGPISPFVCSVPLPPLSSASHTIAIRAVQMIGGQRLESPLSPTISFSFALPSAPQNLRILVGPGL